jgi:hypothetical protein
MSAICPGYRQQAVSWLVVIKMSTRRLHVQREWTPRIAFTLKWRWGWFAGAGLQQEKKLIEARAYVANF